MGDAGPLTPPSLSQQYLSRPDIADEHPIREVTVLVTGFGPFKSFSVNPSWLIASSLPTILKPQPRQPSAPVSGQPPSEPEPYQIRLIVHPSPVRVAYATVATVVPSLMETFNPDYVVHIGMAGGRDHYTLETRAHRDGYKIKDIDDRDGWKEGEHLWKQENIPECLYVGWDEKDVLQRWQREVATIELKMGLKEGLKGEEGMSVCRLSRDAGRFLCEFALMSSLGQRWLEARKGEDGEDKSSQPRLTRTETREGKSAFFHVPGGYSPEDITRGVRIAESVIRSIVGSWEDGNRREESDVLRLASTAAVGTDVEKGRWEGVVWKA